MVALNINGRDHQIDVDAATPLLYVLRGELGLNGAKFGCGLGQCGACTVMIGGGSRILMHHARLRHRQSQDQND